MFRRLFWFFTGAATGVWATVKVNRAVRRLSPDSLAIAAADRALETGARVRLFARDVRAGMTQRETELHDALGLRAQDGPQALPAAGRDSREDLPVLPAQDPDFPASRRGIAQNAYDGRDARRARGAHKNRKDEH